METNYTSMYSTYNFFFFSAGFENIHGKNSALYSLRSGLSNEVPLDIPFRLKKKWGGRSLPGGDMQKSYAPKSKQVKTKSDLFRNFSQKSPMSKL
jgi:hypothetical protein